MVRILVPAARALARHRRIALLLIATGSVALGAAFPVTLLSGGGFAARLGFASLTDVTPGLGWSLTGHGPATTQQQAVGQFYGLLLFVTAAALVVGALTLIGLAASRTPTRDQEIAVARAVGGSRRNLLASTLVEAAAIVLSSLAVGLVVGGAAAHYARASWPGTSVAGALGSTMLVIGAVTVVVVLGLLFPIFFVRRGRVAEVAPHPVALWVPMVQLGLTLAVLTAGVLVTRRATELAQSVGTAADGEVARLPALDLPAPERAARYAALLERVRGSGQFDTVSLTSQGADLGLGLVRLLTTECGMCFTGGIFLKYHYVPAVHQFVTADSFRALGVHLTAGRGIEAGDDWSARKVAVVNRRLAALHFQDGDAIGRRIRIGDQPGDWYDVVGVVDDPPPAGFGAVLQPLNTVYLSILQAPVRSAELVVRPATAAASATLRTAAAESLGISPNDVVITSEARLAAVDAAPLAWFGRWIGAEGWVMLLVSVIGSLVLMRIWVESLRSELGVRRAVGAGRRQVMAYVLTRAVLTAVGGVGVALWFGPVLWSALANLIPGTPAWDPALLLKLSLLLVAATLAGALVPGWRAAVAAPATLLASDGE
ncbi:MAG TPA: FtsX-like permease family protein [Gemmatimonadales bacterium]|nr:FtsX-like permease family protein [Gemmatimonadales bacterium]